MAHSSAYSEHPQHRIEIDDDRVGLRVRIHSKILAETTRGLTLREANYPAVVYVPRDDVHMDRLATSTLSTHCPFKGDANYFQDADDAAGREIAWSYEAPFDQMEAIRGHIAFYADRVTLEPLSD